MTKVSVFGQETEKKKGKPIEFVKLLKNSGNFKEPVETKPNQWDNVQLFGKSEGIYYDIILAWDDEHPDCNSVFLGHWNDGFVE